jgi:hypothetical protein
MITRRSFLIGSGTACATFSLSLFDKYFSYIENHGEPLIEAPNDADDTLYAYPDRSFRLGLNGDPDVWDGPYNDWLDFLLHDQGYDYPSKLSDYRKIYDKWNVRPTELLEEIPFWRMAAIMERRGPGADALNLLKDLDIGPDLGVDEKTLGGLTFYPVPTPIYNYCGVEADNAISLSLLQHRLNKLGQNIEIVLMR